MQAPEADVLNLAAVPEEHEGEEGGEEEELEETIEAAQQQKRLLAERNASLQNKVHQVRPPWSLCFASGAYPSVNAFTKLAMTLVALTFHTNQLDDISCPRGLTGKSSDSD